MNTVVMKRTAPLGRDTAGKRKAMGASYSRHPVDASPEEQLITKQLQWIFSTLNNPRIRVGERKCLLLAGGEMLVDYLARKPLGAAK